MFKNIRRHYQLQLDDRNDHCVHEQKAYACMHCALSTVLVLIIQMAKNSLLISLFGIK